MTSQRISRIAILTTGGTIEKSYSEELGAVENRESLLRQKLLSRLRLPYLTVEVTEVMAKDSLDMDDRDRRQIMESIQKVWPSSDAVIVLHGTDTMEQTAKLCWTEANPPPVPIIFTGAMKPAGFDDSDALQNFTEALYAAQLVSPGYYISFHGHLFTVPNVRKNLKRRTFEVGG